MRDDLDVPADALDSILRIGGADGAEISAVAT
jgi:hypothetical protein